MAARILPNPEQLRELLRYEPETGKLFWRPRIPALFAAGNTSPESRCSAWNMRYADKEAFTSISRYGYKVGAIFDVVLKAHRVAWAIYYGADVPDEIDHINTDRSDNRIDNLRVATHTENCQNQRRHKDGTSGFKGVSFVSATGLWQAKICINSKQKHLGRFTSPEEAYAAYCKAAKKYHGEFARLS